MWNSKFSVRLYCLSIAIAIGCNQPSLISERTFKRSTNPRDVRSASNFSGPVDIRATSFAEMEQRYPTLIGHAKWATLKSVYKPGDQLWCVSKPINTRNSECPLNFSLIRDLDDSTTYFEIEILQTELH
jgi:hypothetical protein